MELLDALEHKVTGLLNEIDALRKQNTKLEARLEGMVCEQSKSATTTSLEEALHAEQELRATVVKRISTLVQYLEEHASAG